MKPKLISFKLCPFVQKAVLTLLAKGVDFDIEYIDLENPPEWFHKISPLGKVPVLQVGDQILFESTVIVEYLNEVYGTTLHPTDPLIKAQNRSWMEFGNECLMNGFNLVVAADEDAFNGHREAMQKKLDQLENQLENQSFFNGDEAYLVDLCFIPFFQRLSYINEVSPGLIDSNRNPKTTQWSKNILELNTVSESTVPEIKQMYNGMMKKRNGFLSTLMAE